MVYRREARDWGDGRRKTEAGCMPRARRVGCLSSTLFDARDEGMEIGEPRRTVMVEPLEDPVPRELPDWPPEKEPVEPPIEPEKVPA